MIIKKIIIYSFAFIIIYNLTFVESIDQSKCGQTKGCLRVPEGCVESDCDYLLAWSHQAKDEYAFEFMGRVKSDHYWIAFALNDGRKMSGGGAVDCIAASNKFIIQSSYNEGHHCGPLNDKYLGLIEKSLSGMYKDGKIYCNFTRVAYVDPSHEEASKVKDLRKSHYVQFANGKSSKEGKKHAHKTYPFVSKNKILFSKNANYDGDDNRALILRLHGSFMVVGWMLIASIGIVSSRFFKKECNEPATICNKPVWFQIHRYSLLLTFIFTIVGFLLMLYQENWTIYLVDVHPILGFIVISLLLLNCVLGLLRPNPVSPHRWIFNNAHAIVGHLAHLFSLIAIFFGLQTESAEMPTWTPWVVIAFATWRLFIEAILSMLNYCNPDQPYQKLTQNEASNNAEVYACRRAIVVCYVIVTIGFALSLLLAINIPIDEEDL